MKEEEGRRESRGVETLLQSSTRVNKRSKCDNM